MQGWGPDLGSGPDPESPPFPFPEESDYLTEYEDEGPELMRGEEEAFAPTEWPGAGTLEAVSTPQPQGPSKMRPLRAWGLPRVPQPHAWRG